MNKINVMMFRFPCYNKNREEILFFFNSIFFLFLFYLNTEHCLKFCIEKLPVGNLRKVHVVLYNFGNVAQSGFMKENYLSI